MARILIVDDDAFLANIYADRLKQAGYEVQIACHGEEGKKYATKQHPDGIVLDIVMPKMDGFTLLAELKADPETRMIPVIMLTNLAQKEDIDRCLELGACRYLIKCHTSPDQVVDALQQVLAA